MEKDSRIFVAGHRGLVGSAIVRKLLSAGHTALITPTRQEVDLLDQDRVHALFREQRIEHAIIAAARVGGIAANIAHPADFLVENLLIATNTIRAAFEAGTEKLLFLSSSCMYPRLAPQPMREDVLLSGPLEPTNEGYALAKIAGVKLCEYYNRQHRRRFISATPSNIYGPGDNFDRASSHVIPALMRRFHDAKVTAAADVTVWGSGKARREFLHVEDLAEAIELLMARYEEPGTINVGSGSDLSIAELAEMMKSVTGFEGRIVFDASKPDGMPRKMLDSSRMFGLGWRPRRSLRDGLAETYAWATAHGAFAQEPQPVG